MSKSGANGGWRGAVLERFSCDVCRENRRKTIEIAQDCASCFSVLLRLVFSDDSWSIGDRRGYLGEPVPGGLVGKEDVVYELFVVAVEYSVPLFEELLFVESLEYFRCSSGKPGPQLRVAHQSVQCRFELTEVVCGDDESIDFVADNFAGSTGTIECHDGQAAGERFGDDVAEAFVTGRQDEEFGPSQPMLDVGDPTWQRDLLAESQFVDELFEFLALIAFAEQHEMPVGVLLDESAEDGQQSVESFLRMQSSDAEEDVSSG